MRVFVTGGTGFLGRHLVPSLEQQGYTVRVLARDPAKHAWLKRHAAVEVVRGDLSDGVALAESMRGCDMVIHAAGLFRFWGTLDEFRQTNVAGTANLLQAVAQVGVQRMVHVSTVAVIGGTSTPHIVIDETYTPNPADPYQQSKLEAEQLVLAAHQTHQTPVIVLRPGAYYGPLGTYAFNRLFFKDPMRGIIMQVDGGRHVVFPVYIQDVVNALLLALHRGRLGEVYNICGEPLSHREVFDTVCRLADIRFPRLAIPKQLAIVTSQFLTGLSTITHREPFYPINMRSYVFNDWRVSSRKAQQELGFVPTAFEVGAAQTIAWYRAGEPDDLSEL